VDNDEPTPDSPVDLGALLTPGQVASYLGVPQGTLANWRYLGRGPRFARVGRHVRYAAGDLAAWLDEQRERSDMRRVSA
jgi:excisionase family DNA binding protein